MRLSLCDARNYDVIIIQFRGVDLSLSLLPLDEWRHICDALACFTEIVVFMNVSDGCIEIMLSQVSNVLWPTSDGIYYFDLYFCLLKVVNLKGDILVQVRFAAPRRKMIYEDAS